MILYLVLSETVILYTHEKTIFVAVQTDNLIIITKILSDKDIHQ
jgi:hypothetical protein